MRDERIRKVVTLLGATIEYATQASASFAADLSGDVAPLERQLEALSYVLCVYSTRGCQTPHLLACCG